MLPVRPVWATVSIRPGGILASGDIEFRPNPAIVTPVNPGKGI